MSFMEKNMFFEKMQETAKKLNIHFCVEQLEQFFAYMNLLIEWNEKMNLTAIIEPEEIILKHFIDSITILKNIESKNKSKKEIEHEDEYEDEYEYEDEDENKNKNDNIEIVDVGTGAGFPGIPLSIMNPTLKITLVDSLNKRLIFLQEVVDKLNLKNIKIIHARAEEFGQNKNYREKFDFATSRAVANLSTLSEYLIPLVKINGKVISMKASEAHKEIDDAKNAIRILGGKIEKIEEFNLPESDIGRTIIIIKKEKQTPNKYPRKPGTPSKEPIK